MSTWDEEHERSTLTPGQLSVWVQELLREGASPGTPVTVDGFDMVGEGEAVAILFRPKDRDVILHRRFGNDHERANG